MAERIEDYGLIGDLQTAALVSRHGSIDWLCFPRFDSGACFAALLGDEENGPWSLGPVGEVTGASRRYRGDTLSSRRSSRPRTATVRLIDFMPPRGEAPDVVRIVEGVDGTVRDADASSRSASTTGRSSRGCEVATEGSRSRSRSGRTARSRHRSSSSGRGLPHGRGVRLSAGRARPLRAHVVPRRTCRFRPTSTRSRRSTTPRSSGREWVRSLRPRRPLPDALVRSLVTLKALTYAPTGGIVAAPTTSLPEALGGVRNWDYRFCWLRDATLTLPCAHARGLRGRGRRVARLAPAGDRRPPRGIQIMYGIAGERRLTELELDWLPGTRARSPCGSATPRRASSSSTSTARSLDALYHARVGRARRRRPTPGR